MTYLQKLQGASAPPMLPRAMSGMLIAACSRVFPDSPANAAGAMAVVTIIDMDEMTPEERAVLGLVTMAIHQVTGEILKEMGINLDPGAMV